MKTVKMIFTGVMLAAALVILAPGCKKPAAEFPEWVPKGAIEQGKKRIRFFAYFHNEIGSMYSRDSNRVEIDSARCVLKHPVEYVQIDYLNYTSGCNIKDFIFDKVNMGRAYVESFYIFDIYQGDSCVGHMRVYRMDGKWRGLGNPGRSFLTWKKGKNLLREISKMYPWRDGYKIYLTRGVFHSAFLIEQDNQIVKILDYRTRVSSRDGYYEGLLEVPIDRYMLIMKEKIKKEQDSKGSLKKVG